MKTTPTPSPTRPPTSRKAHRVGPVEYEAEIERAVQRCLRCDIVLFVALPGQIETLKVGRRVFMDWNVCPGGIDVAQPITYEDE